MVAGVVERICLPDHQHGDPPDISKNHAALKGVTIPKTGRPGRIGVLVTKTLAIAGEPGLLVLHLLKSHPLDAGQAEEVRAVLEAMTGGKPKKSGSSTPAKG